MPIGAPAARVHELVADLRAARLRAGLSQAAVMRAIGRSRELLSLWERGIALPGVLDLARWAGAVGLEVPYRAFPAGAPVRDTPQLRVLERAQVAIGPNWGWLTEVPVARDPRDRRAFDAVIHRGLLRVAIEIITRLVDVQAQVRAANLKLEASGIDRMILVLPTSRHNREALAVAAPTLGPAFPLGSRAVLRDLRAGRLPRANGVLLV